jgi:tRNA-dihydrouridine synthase
VTVVANIFGTTIDEFVAITKRLDGEDGVHALELNVSCPNVKQGGLLFGCDADLAAQVTAAVRAATQMPVWVKMSPEAGDPIGVARACQRAGADAITAINTIRGAAIDIETQKPRVHHRTGGLSGPAIKPLALRIVWDLAAALDIPVIGIGGIATAEAAIEFLLAGATAIQVGTAGFADPCAGANSRTRIVAYCERQARCGAGPHQRVKAAAHDAPSRGAPQIAGCENTAPSWSRMPRRAPTRASFPHPFPRRIQLETTTTAQAENAQVSDGRRGGGRPPGPARPSPRPSDGTTRRRRAS